MPFALQSVAHLAALQYWGFFWGRFYKRTRVKYQPFTGVPKYGCAMVKTAHVGHGLRSHIERVWGTLVQAEVRKQG